MEQSCAKIGHVWRVVFITGPVIVPGVENRVWSTSWYTHTYTHTPPVSLWIKERYKVFLWFLITLQFGATCVPRVMHKHQLEYAAAQCWFTRSIWAELLKGKLFFIDRNLLASSNRMCECVEVGIHDIPVLFFCFSFFLNSSGIWPQFLLGHTFFSCFLV